MHLRVVCLSTLNLLQRKDLAITSPHIYCFMDFLETKIVCWNVRGAVNVCGQRVVRDLVDKFQLEIFILVETHCPFSRAASFCERLGYEVCGKAEASGFAGGIWIMGAKNRNFAITVVDTHHQVVIVQLVGMERTWTCSAVYASPTPHGRDGLWDHLFHLKRRLMSPWFLIGDFNEIAYPSEMKNGIFCSQRAQRFLAMMERCELIDLGAIDNKLTWFRRTVAGQSTARSLDRALGGVDWCHLFPEAVIENLPRMHSDHSHFFSDVVGLTLLRGHVRFDS